jgi:serine/threonine-protein kinase
MRLLTEGQLIRDTYEVERFLGEGAFAEVYRVKHRFLGRQAMKVFKRVGMGEEEILEMLGEAILLTHIGHPNIVRVFEANILESAQGTCGYFTMEHIAGGSLDKFWRSHGGKFVPVTATIDLMRQICRGLSIAHNEKPPIIHRDIKPQNILVGYEADGLRARVSDFGLAKKVNPLTLLATAAGTFAFKPPETFSARRSDSCAADVWAIGMTLYLLLTDKLPFNIPAPVTNGVGRAFEVPLVKPSTINPDADDHLDEIVAKALALKSEDRFATAGELLDSLEKWTPATVDGRRKRKTFTSEPSKTILGTATGADSKLADKLTMRALQARENGRLAEAADLMEEAFNKLPDLRAKYAHQVRLWRCGVSM